MRTSMPLLPMSGINISSLCEPPAMSAWERSTSRQIGERVATNGRSLAVLSRGLPAAWGPEVAGAPFRLFVWTYGEVARDFVVVAHDPDRGFV
jgi:hypothetical protein